MTPLAAATPPVLVTLPGDVVGAIRAHAREALPDECCGFLLGHAPGDVRASARAANRAADSRSRFALDPAEVLAAHRSAARAGRDVVGFYHSHPRGPATPSAHDRALAWPGHVYVIAAGDSLRAFVAPAPGAPFAEFPVAIEAAP